MSAPSAQTRECPATWAIALAFTLVYLSWGTTYFVIRQGVHAEQLPPALFGGVRVCLAGLILLLYLGVRGHSLRLPGREAWWVLLGGLMLFVGGNGLITAALDWVPSSTAAVLVATTPLWMALMEGLLPRGERLAPRAWAGLFLGLGGVVLLMAEEWQGLAGLPQCVGIFLVLGSALFWASGSLVLRYRQRRGPHLVAAAYQMAAGGGGLTLVGLAVGETGRLTGDTFTPGAVFAFCYLLVVSSLVGFVAFNYLLRHVSAVRLGTYAYVNPLVAILVGCSLGKEKFSGWIALGVVIILAGVALVRQGGRRADILVKSAGAVTRAETGEFSREVATPLDSASHLARP